MSETAPSAERLEQMLLRELSNAQLQLDLLREQLNESQRLATIGTISAVIAHEFNNLLTPVISYSQYALKSIDSPTPDIPLIRKALAKSLAGSEKAGKICSSMLGLARGESSTGAVEVQSIVDEVLNVMARDPQKDGIALRVQITPGLAVRADRVQIEQVLLNLLINARQAMAGKGGSITIKAAAIDDSEEVRIQVMDTGPGIPEQNLTKIFEPFFTTKGTAKKGENKGTGLGLAICRQILEHHRGKIDVSSELGKGICFNIYLPLHRESNSQSTEAA